ncbi:MAG TPA: protein-glutamate O-methyltransferase CheR [Pirellulaceae bacterium]|nr:protein-glutamate O-methyltransferase CheR [Pirellulaceae bacterium]
MTTLVAPQVSDELLSRYAKLIYDMTGICISPQKKALLSNRLRRRLRETGIADFEAYYKHLRTLKQSDPEWDGFLQEITTHETYLFRDSAHWQWFQEQFLPQISAAARTSNKPKNLRIWSAACSTGDEAFTVATCIAASLPNFQQWKIKILGTDIGVDAVQQARKATFSARSMHLVPTELQERWFIKQGENGPWLAKPALREMVEFRRHNLLAPLNEPAFDLILLKNVLIYFDGPSKTLVLNNMRRAFKPGTFLLAGAAEGISDLVKDLQRHQPWLFSSV